MRKGAILLLVLSLVVTACRASTAETTVVADVPTQATTTSTSTPTTVMSETDASDAEAARRLERSEILKQELAQLNEMFMSYPMTFDLDSGTVTIEERPESIVSLSASHTEMLYAVGAGDQVVATDLTSNYPAAAETTVKLDSFQFSIEEVAALEPDLVILAFDFQGEAEALSALDIPFVLMGPPEDLLGAFSQLSFVGLMTDHRSEAEALLSDLFEQIDRIHLAADRIRGRTFYHEVDEALYSATSSSFIGDLYRYLGLVNIADAAGLDTPFPQLSAEFIVDQNPEFIFLADANFGVTVESVAARPGWDSMVAVTEGNVVALDGDLAGRWGPRTVELMASILEAVEERLS
jgi:iron complex transport system substrate-binding protein